MVNRLYRHIDPKLEINLVQHLPENLMVFFLPRFKIFFTMLTLATVFTTSRSLWT